MYTRAALQPRAMVRMAQDTGAQAGCWLARHGCVPFASILEATFLDGYMNLAIVATTFDGFTERDVGVDGIVIEADAPFKHDTLCRAEQVAS